MKSNDNKGANKKDSLRKIILSGIEDLVDKNKDAYDLIVSKVNEDFFESYQTRGKLKELAENLVRTTING